MTSASQVPIDLTTADSLFDAAGPNIRPLVHFWETVFTGSKDETPDKTHEIRDLVERSLSSDYTFNGQKSTADELMAFRAQLLERFTQLRTVVTASSSVPIEGTDGLDAALTLIWHSVADSTTGIVELRGANLIGSKNLQAVANTQIGNPAGTWQPFTRN